MSLHLSTNARYWPAIFDLLLTFTLVACCMATAHWKKQNPEQLPWLGHDASQHLGAEHNQIAFALYQGRGFSDPFHGPTGPTSWMPPVLPTLMATAYWLFSGSKSHVIQIMIFTNAFSVLVSTWIVLRQARKLQLVLVSYAIVVVGLIVNFHQLFQSTSDSGILMLVVNLLWLGIASLTRVKWSNGRCVGWGAFGGFCALCSPVIGGVWAVLTSMYLLRSKAGLVPLAISAFMAIVVVAPWTVRNRVVFGTWIPIKWNGMYELWQSQCLDNEGVLDSRTLFDQPFSGYSTQRKQYQEIGEIAFVREKGKIATRSIYENPVEFVRRLANRWSAACLYYMPMKAAEDLAGGGWPIFWKRLVFPAPFLSLIVVLILRPFPFESELWTALAIYFFGLLPYVIISYYERYATPLLCMKMLLVLFGLHSLVSSRTFLTFLNRRMSST